MFSSFQFGFQAGFQVVYPSAKIPAYNGNSTKEYVPYGYEVEYYKRQERLAQLERKEQLAKQDLLAQELKIEQLELDRLRKGLSDKNLQIELLKLLNEQQIINMALLQYQAEIQELLLDQEALLVIMLTMDF